MKLQIAIALASLLASSALQAQTPAAGSPGATKRPAAAGQAAPAADPFVHGKPLPPDGSEPAAPPANLSVCVECFSLDLADAALLQRTVADDSELYKEILSRVSKGTAAQEHFGIVRARSGERATVENVAEVYSPQAYDFGNVSQSPEPQPTNPPVPAAATPGPPLPVAFQTRHAGFKLEIEPTMSMNQEIIDLRISPEIVTLVDRSKWGKGIAEVEMPEFESQRMTLAVTLKPRVPVLLGTPSRPPVSKADPDSAKKVWFSFVTVSVIKVQ
jgi:hypothetical protein